MVPRRARQWKNGENVTRTLTPAVSLLHTHVHINIMEHYLAIKKLCPVTCDNMAAFEGRTLQERGQRKTNTVGS